MAILNVPSTGESGIKSDTLDPESGLATIHSIQQGQHCELVGTKRQIKSRHAQMLAIGGSIGTNLFIGTGQALAIGGPGLLLLAFCIMAFSVFGVVTAICEVGSYIPVSGNSMSSLCTRYVSRSLGFAMGWLYVYSFGMIVAYELTAIVIIIDYWPNSVHPAVWVSAGFVFFLALNLCPVGLYGESEFWFAGIKVIMATGLMLLALVLMLGGGPPHERLGYRYWRDPGAVNSYIVKGAGGQITAFLYVWVFSGFSFFFAPEQLILTSGEMIHPRKNLPSATQRFFFRLVFFYVLGAASIGVICPSNAPGLTSGAGNANASPWVIAITSAQIDVLPSIINGGILTAALSAGNAYLFMSARSLYSLAMIGDAPKIFTRCTSWGIPIYAVLACSCFGLFGFLVLDSEAGQVLNWLISITNTAGYTSWIACCVIYIRFHMACPRQDIKLPYRSIVQPYAAWICLSVFSFLLLANGFTVFYPGRFTVSGFLAAYVGIPIFLFLWLGHRFTAGRSHPWWREIGDIDLITGVAEVEAEAKMWDALEKRRERVAAKKWLSKVRILWG
ncbi:putative proline-specific permease put4 [Colletotrichum fructicola]|nr:putative proline-specific permease put4 [Colletotrichum fructicola]KAF4936782.1 putative proline-specific permease put4 [Colletotrichum fructicola]